MGAVGPMAAIDYQRLVLQIYWSHWRNIGGVNSNVGLVVLQCDAVCCYWLLGEVDRFLARAYLGPSKKRSTSNGLPA